MRDPRFEPAQLDVVGGCTAGLASTLRARLPPEAGAHSPSVVRLEVTRIDGQHAPVRIEAPRPHDAESLDLPLPPLEAGAYSARLSAADGSTTRHDFACEAGGDEWADTRPDPKRLEALAEATGGVFATATDVGSVRLPRPTTVSAERHVTPIAPPWAWTLSAAALLGIHWITRRRNGLS
jgi:hypothetical protein